jgi:hypothetical protein
VRISKCDNELPPTRPRKANTICQKRVTSARLAAHRMLKLEMHERSCVYERRRVHDADIHNVEASDAVELVFDEAQGV